MVEEGDGVWPKRGEDGVDCIGSAAQGLQVCFSLFHGSSIPFSQTAGEAESYLILDAASAPTILDTEKGDP